MIDDGFVDEAQRRGVLVADFTYEWFAANISSKITGVASPVLGN